MVALITGLLGFLFGAILVYGRLNKFDTISGAARLTDFTVPKAIAVTIGVGVMFLALEIGIGLAEFHVKPFMTGGIILGGLLFGAGMAILGYCPGTLFVSAGEGALDAMVGIVGGLSGGVVFTLLLPSIEGVLGPDLGKLSLASITGGSGFLYGFLVIVIGVAFISVAMFLHRKEKTSDMRWLYSGIALAILNSVVFLTAVSNRPIGASTAFPYLGDRIVGLTNNSYFEKITKPGLWELVFLTGALLAGFVFSLIKKDFKFRMIYSGWKYTKGGSVYNRALWAFAGGFILVFGARMAGGCTSGHIISGGMQLAFSSLVFAVFVFTGLLLTGKVFYGKKQSRDTE
ncbi:MAG: YeeE/YedE family protein [Chlorobi bacterium]|nr:YeeE/YedE family protein [Chlorobiota bacterium]